ncbi:MAG: hypothetical protein E7675_00765 [Ruminococcaceae bacterium]|nr:hypothetical protein [Oscillospiraceae bacterium]
MKRITALLLLLVMALLLVSCDNTPKETTSAPTALPTKTPTNIPKTTEDTTPTPSDTADATPSPSVDPSPEPTDTSTEKKVDTMECRRNGSTCTINVVTIGLKNTELGVVVFKGSSTNSKWQEEPDLIVDIAQISVDNRGKGTVAVTIDEEITDFAIKISFDGGEYTYFYSGGQS